MKQAEIDQLIQENLRLKASNLMLEEARISAEIEKSALIEKAASLEENLQEKSAQLSKQEKEARQWKLAYQAIVMRIHQRKSNKRGYVDPNQIMLPFGDYIQTPGIEIPAEEVAKKEEEAANKPAKKKKKSAPRGAFMEGLRVKEVIVEPKNLPEGAVCIGHDVSDVLEYQPSKLFVIRYLTKKYTYQKAGESTVVQATMPNRFLPGSLVGEKLLAYILASKYVHHLPLYRIQRIFKDLGSNIPESTLGNWAIKALEGLHIMGDVLKKEVLKSRYLQADETHIPVLGVDKKGKAHQGYYWAFHSPPDKLVYFEYSHGRNKGVPLKILLEFEGFLQTDRYAGYNEVIKRSIGKILLALCHAHARRKFVEAEKNSPELAKIGITFYQRLYKIELDCKDCTPVERQLLRQEHSKKILEDLFAWAEKQIDVAIPGTLIYKAFKYLLDGKEGFSAYLDNGILEIDNNLIENKMRPIAIGRKNYLFAGSERAASMAATLYSLEACCKMHNIPLQEYLESLFIMLPDTSIQNLDSLLPHNIMKVIPTALENN